MICLICTDERIREINREMLLGRTSRAVAEKFKLGIWITRSHRKKCLPYRKPNAKPAVTVVEQMEELKRELWRLQLLAEAGENVSQALAVVRQRQSLLELEARSLGQLDPLHKKLLLANKAPEGEYEVVFTNGRPKTVPVLAGDK